MGVGGVRSWTAEAVFSTRPICDERMRRGPFCLFIIMSAQERDGSRNCAVSRSPLALDPTLLLLCQSRAESVADEGPSHGPIRPCACQQCTMGPVCRCPAPPTAPPTAPPGSETPPHAAVGSVAHNAATYARLLKDVRPHPSPPSTPSAWRYFLHLSCQLMSCQTGSDLSRDYAGKV